VFFGPRLGKPGAGWVGVVLGMGVPLVLATVVLVGWLGESAASREALTAGAMRLTWATLGTVDVTVGVKLDSLTVVMFFMVAFIAFWIFVFSVGYMAGHSDEVAGQSKYHRFFAYLSLFGFSMLGLVVSSSLLFLFIFWELVGLCSYLLIGFYFDKGFASRAAIKAFVTNRVGDFGFIIGLMLVFFHLRTFDLDEAAVNFAAQFHSGTGLFASQFTLFGWSLPTIMGIALFCGAMGKSAQFPLHVWLPDAMAGPTPVSALIHAATMVAAGVYLVARVFCLMTPEALVFIAGIGCITLTLMALVAIVQTDIKKCLAYSTLSQLGYMIFGLGCGAWIAALFHLITHAFFKAMLFLGSGQVIEGCHHEQDMRKMGGLIRKMPVTAWTFLVGVLAIAGTGLPGIHIGDTKLGLGGFFSKDEILAVAWVRAYRWQGYDDVFGHGDGASHGDGGSHAGAEPVARPTLRLASFQHEGDAHRADAREVVSPGHAAPGGDATAAHHRGDAAPHAGKGVAPDRRAVFAGMNHALPAWMFWAAIITAYVTPLYMMRCWWMTFMGAPRDERVHQHAHETPLMFVPLIVLAVGTCFASYFLFRPLIADAAPAATNAAMVLAVDGTSHAPAVKAAHGALVPLVGFAFLIGFGVALAIYRNGLDTAGRIKRFAGPLHTLLEKKYYIDEIYGLVWVKGCLAVAAVARFVDTWLIDLIVNMLAGVTARIASLAGMTVDAQFVDGVVNGVATSSMDVATVFRRPQTGRIRNYVLLTAASAAIVIICVLVFASGRTSRSVGAGAGDTHVVLAATPDRISHEQ
ncbi:MAG: NADH-quinone oxidoreductase subunit L, partial [Phycisphaerae bacterium]